MNLAALEQGVAHAHWQATIVFAIGGLVLLPFVWRALGAIPTSLERQASWGVRYGVLAVFVGLLALAMSSEIVDVTLGGVEDGGGGILGGLLNTILALLLLSLAVVLVVRRLQPDGLQALGLGRNGAGWAFALGLACYVMLYPGLLALGNTWPWLLSELGREIEPQPILMGIRGLGGPELLVAAVAAVLVGPFLEELLFRGFLQAALSRRLGVGGGILGTAVVFSLLHPVEGFALLFALSVLLGCLRWRSGSIWAGWGVHAVHNAVTLSLTLLAPEIPKYPG